MVSLRIVLNKKYAKPADKKHVRQSVDTYTLPSVTECLKIIEDFQERLGEELDAHPDYVSTYTITLSETVRT